MKNGNVSVSKNLSSRVRAQSARIPGISVTRAQCQELISHPAVQTFLALILLLVVLVASIGLLPS